MTPAFLFGLLLLWRFLLFSCLLVYAAGLCSPTGFRLSLARSPARGLFCPSIFFLSLWFYLDPLAGMVLLSVLWLVVPLSTPSGPAIPVLTSWMFIHA
jgi:hypothetical protein